MKIIATVLLCCLLTACGDDTYELVTTFQRVCAVPIRMDVSKSTLGTSIEMHCDKVTEAEKKHD